MKMNNERTSKFYFGYFILKSMEDICNQQTNIFVEQINFSLGLKKKKHNY